MATEHGHFINGKRVAGESGRFGDVFNPTTGEKQSVVSLAARAMRQVAIDYARARLAERRGEGRKPLNIDDIDPSLMQLDSHAEELVHLDAALTQLGEVDARALQVAELRYFAGMEVAEIAEALALSEATIKRDSRFAREFLEAAIAG